MLRSVYWQQRAATELGVQMLFKSLLRLLGITALVAGLVAAPAALFGNDTLAERAPAVAAVVDSQVSDAEAYRTSGAYGNYWCSAFSICGNVGASTRSNRCISVTGRAARSQVITREVCAGQTARTYGIWDVDSFYVGFDEIVIGGPGGQGFTGPRRVYTDDLDRSTFTVLRR